MSEEIQRRLAAIVAIDVVGYSRLMDADEAGTLAALRAYRTDLVEPALRTWGGRTVKTMGDGLLLEFNSVVAAVEFAITLQTGLAKSNRDVPADKAITCRIGIHLGDVIIDGDDIFGSGVNVASRIEALAKPGGIALSEDAYRQVRDRLEVGWEDSGEHEVKNIARPVHIWHWCPETAASTAPAVAGSAAADKPSIAVLPFDAMSSDPEQEYFADGLTEDLITDLSKVSGLFVVARNSSMVFKGKAVDIREAARRLGVRYVLEGSVRKAGARVRINVQLIDAATGGHLWAERYDGAVEDVFELQDDVGARVVSALEVRLRGDEGERLRQVHTSNLEAYEVYVRAKAMPYPPIPERMEAARALFEQVIERDPDFAGGYAGVSWMLAFAAFFRHEDASDTLARAEALARRAIGLDASFGWSYVALAVTLVAQRRHDEALAAIDDAVARQPNDADAHAYRGLLLGLSGHPEQGVEPIDLALSLNPQFVNGPYLNFRGIVLALAGDYRHAVESFERNLARHGPVAAPAIAFHALACEGLGRHDEAQTIAGKIVSRLPGFRLDTWNLAKLIRADADRERALQMMRAAGVPG